MTLEFDSLVSYYSIMEADSTEPLLSIAEVAERANVSRRTVRYYVQRGLIDAPLGRGRGSAYTPKHVDQIQRVLRLQREGVTLETIEQLPEGADAAEPARPAVPATVVLRIPLRPGIQLEVNAGTSLPSQHVIEQLAAACEQILNGTGDIDDDDKDDAIADSAEWRGQ
jgi:DNA-binding transcriptional MerR regulator